MTDREKLEKIRAEIEKRRDKNSKAKRIESALEDNAILSLISSMQKEPKECMYSKDNYKDEDRKIFCDGCKEECKFNKKEEPVSENLVSVAEEFIQEHTKNCSNDFKGWQKNGLPIYASWLTPDKARKAVEIAREEVIVEVCEWIDVNYVRYLDVSTKGTLTANIRQFITDLKQAMKDDLKN